MSDVASRTIRLRHCAASLYVLALLGVGLPLMGIPLWRLGRSTEDKKEILKNYRAPADTEARFDYVMNYARFNSDYNDVIFFGSSVCCFDVNPVQFEQEHGLRAFNLGLLRPIGVRPYTVVLRHYLSHHPKPRLACLCLNLANLNPPDDEITRNSREQFLWAYGSETESRQPQHADATIYYISQGVKTVFGALSGGIERRLRDPMQWPATISYREQQAESDALRGAMVWYRPQVMDEIVKRDLIFKDPFPLTDDFRSSLRALESECRDHGLRLVLRLTPMPQAPRPEALRSLNESLAGLELAYPTITLCRPALLEYQPSDFIDAVHLNTDAARRFTTQVGDDVMHAMAAKPTATD